jgi:hypothetical protein
VSSSVLKDVLANAVPIPSALSYIDILFEPSLELDPLALFRQLSRVTPIVVAWPGMVSSSGLSYAMPEHANYRLWTNPEVEIVALPH